MLTPVAVGSRNPEPSVPIVHPYPQIHTVPPPPAAFIDHWRVGMRKYLFRLRFLSYFRHMRKGVAHKALICSYPSAPIHSIVDA